MHPPAFWFRPRHRPGLRARLLAPLAAVWSWAGRRRLAGQTPERLGIPVVCVGNLTLGGAGKTPTVIALVSRLVAQGVRVHVISRGHGGSLEGPVAVDERRHSAAEVGDEPLLIAPFAPVWVARDRAAAGRAAEAAGAEIVIMDDGFQNPALAKDLSIVVVDAATGFGNGRVVPSGPLREPVARGLARADMVLAIGAPADRAAFAAAWPETAALPVAGAALAPLDTGMAWEGLRAFAFAGIGRPAKFFATLRALGAEIVAAREFADHAVYDRRILSRLDSEAHESRAQLVTTEKDAVRLPPDFRRKIIVVPVRLALDDWAPLDTALARIRRPMQRGTTSE
ncbi:tetraacyldisaccharide 4'-kinase [Rhodobacteraceae bacterium DSL-40]|uniref:tetraacyldisaccharide 4'-kinase n=1 Tax=Amaricoccus sp. B4 TaxID=3368557 RepID=UPI000DAC3931